MPSMTMGWSAATLIVCVLSARTPRTKVKLRGLHGLALQKPHQMFVQKRHVQRVQALEVGAAVLLQRQVGAVAVIVVQREFHRP